MAREYQSLGPAKKSEHLHIPMTLGDIQRLTELAKAKGVPKTELARNYILDSLDKEPAE